MEPGLPLKPDRVDKGAGLTACVTPKSNDFGLDGWAMHSDGYIIVQCKRNSTANKVGRETIQQFKGVAEEQNAYRGYVITTSTFTEGAIASAALTSKIMLVAMDDLVRWHAEPPTF
jgi:restriction system protein